jgi:DNA-binding NarL/FixJ family response regulator
MTPVSALDRGRQAFGRRAWRAAYDQLSAADREHPLDLDDLERLGTAAYLVGEPESDLLVRAHHEAIREGQPTRAARFAFWLGFGMMDRGEHAQAGGWLARGGRLVEDLPDTVEHGYLQLPSGLGQLDAGDFEEAFATFEQVGAIADRFADADLGALSRLGRGLALTRTSDVQRGVSFLDEAMIAVTADEVSPMIVGIIYCAVIETCQQLFDLRRAQEWTSALSRWCEAQPDLVPFRGQCLLYRAELLQLHGAWGEASMEARQAHDQLIRPPVDPAAGAALYQQGEIHRLRGDVRRANEAYHQGAAYGHATEPGLPLLRLQQGNVEAAVAAIRRALDEATDPLARPRLLEASVEIALAAGDSHAAEAAWRELAEIAARFRAPLLAAMAARAEGAVRLAAAEPGAALPALRRSLRTWQDVAAPYEVARTQALISHASKALGDQDTAALELDAARKTFARLGAQPDLARLDAMADRTAGAVGGLTARELEVLRLVAAGMTNRAIAEELVLSEKTVARHVANIFVKLGVSSRSAATAYAYEHALVVPGT